jgi:hypothetical protein
MAGKDLAATFTLVIDLEYDNSEIKQSVLDHTEATYDWVLKLFNLSVWPPLSLSILSIYHPLYRFLKQSVLIKRKI